MKLMLNKISILFLVVITGIACTKQFHIEQKYVRFDSTRAALSLQYLEDHYGIKQQLPTINPRMVVVHWTAVPTFDKTYEVFYPPTLGGSRPDIEGAGALNVSAHYLVDRDGHIARLLPDTVMARHVIGLNHAAIGIENVGGENQPLTDAQLKANAWLIRRLSTEHNIEYLLGHYEYTLFEEHPLWMEKDDKYRTEKVDPGIDFMQNLRSELKELDLKGAPNSGKL